MRDNMKEGHFHCFDRFQQRVFRNGGRVTNRCFTNWEPYMKGQFKSKRRAMTEAEVSAVVQLTGHKPYLEERYV